MSKVPEALAIGAAHETILLLRSLSREQPAAAARIADFLISELKSINENIAWKVSTQGRH